MKSILNRIAGFSAVVIFAILIAVFIINLRQEEAIPEVNTQWQSGYPPPENLATQPDAYPAPSNVLATNQQNSCENVGSWTTFSHPEGIYSLQYPSESQLRESNDYISITLQPSCYDELCSGSNRIVISILENPQELDLEDFISEEFQLLSAPQHQDSLDNFQSGTSQIEVAGMQSLRIEDGVTLNKPDIFIPYQDEVIWIYIAKTTNLPPHPSPCDKTLSLLDEILDSLELYP